MVTDVRDPALLVGDLAISVAANLIVARSVPAVRDQTTIELTWKCMRAPRSCGRSAAVADAASYRPSLSLSQMVQRILATAGFGNGTRNDQVGYGLVDPIRAATVELPARASATSQPAGRSTGLSALAGLAGALLVAVVAITIRGGNRRAWRSTRAPL